MQECDGVAARSHGHERPRSFDEHSDPGCSWHRGPAAVTALGSERPPEVDDPIHARSSAHNKNNLAKVIPIKCRHADHYQIEQSGLTSRQSAAVRLVYAAVSRRTAIAAAA